MCSSVLDLVFCFKHCKIQAVVDRLLIFVFILSPESCTVLIISSKSFTKFQFLVSRLCIICNILFMMCCGRLISSSLGPTSVPLRNFWSGLHQDCVASLQVAPIFILLLPSLLKLVLQILDHASFLVFLSFIDGCLFNETAFVARIRFLFHSGPHCVNLSRDLFLLALRHCTSPFVIRALSTFFPGKLPPTGFCLAIPLFVLPTSTLFGHGTL